MRSGDESQDVSLSFCGQPQRPHEEEPRYRCWECLSEYGLSMRPEGCGLMEDYRKHEGPVAALGDRQ